MKALRTLTILSALVALFSAPCMAASAEPQTITFTVETNIEPITGIGLLMKQNGVVQKPGVQFSKLDKGIWKASFTAEPAELEQYTLASVMLLSSEGDIASSNVRSLKAITAPAIPKCSPQQAVVVSADTQISVLQSLVSVRSARRDNSQARVAEMLKGEFLETLKKLEKGFGLSRGTELSASLPPTELVDRLSRVLNAIRNYRANNKPEK